MIKTDKGSSILYCKRIRQTLTDIILRNDETEQVKLEATGIQSWGYQPLCSKNGAQDRRILFPGNAIDRFVGTRNDQQTSVGRSLSIRTDLSPTWIQKAIGVDSHSWIHPQRYFFHETVSL